MLKQLVTTILLSVGLATPALASDDYIGISVRPNVANDPTNVGVVSKFTIKDFVAAPVSISTRPAVLFGDSTEVRVPLTVDYSKGNLRPFGGVGVATGVNGDNASPYVTAGVDVDSTSRVVLGANVNHIFVDNGDTEVMLNLGYKF